VTQFAPGVPTVVADCIDRGLSKKPEDRNRSAEDALAALEGLPR
jgi:hypothetical protein